MKLNVLAGAFSVCRLSPDENFFPLSGAFVSVTRTADELSVVCETSIVPSHAKAEHGWRLLKVDGTLDFALTGILSQLTEPLAEAQISLFAISTFDTDYVLVKSDSFDRACAVLKAHGHAIAP